MLCRFRNRSGARAESAVACGVQPFPDEETEALKRRVDAADAELESLGGYQKSVIAEKSWH